MNRDSLRQAVNVIACVSVIVVNALANIVPINGQQTGEISDRFPVLFVPAGYVFSIWGLIYALLIAFTVYQALPAQHMNVRLRRIGWLFALSCLWNCLWILCWHYNLFPVSLVVMVALLATLVAIYLRLNIGKEKVARAEQWVVHVPFSVYLGWITVAAIANATDVLYALGWNGQPLDPAVWAILMLIIATSLTIYVLMQRRDIAYSLVIVWAFVGIFVKQAGTPTVAFTAIIGAGIVALLVVVSGWQNTMRMRA